MELDPAQGLRMAKITGAQLQAQAVLEAAIEAVDGGNSSVSI
jgi:hypothetical protein